MDAETPSSPRTTLLLTGFIMLLFIAAGYFIFMKGSIIPTPEVLQPTPIISQTQLVGVIRSAGLLPEEQERLGLAGVSYQLTELTGFLSGEPAGYYLLGDGQYGGYEGRCVIVRGEIPDGWQDRPKDDIYNRSAFLVKDMSPTQFTDCSPYVNRSITAQEYETIERFEGIVEHLVRPSPDIGYDYLLRLTVPYISETNASGLPQEIDTIVIVPTNNEQWNILEEKMGNAVTLEGIMRWGYAESRHLEITSIALP